MTPFVETVTSLLFGPQDLTKFSKTDSSLFPDFSKINTDFSKISHKTPQYSSLSDKHGVLSEIRVYSVFSVFIPRRWPVRTSKTENINILLKTPKTPKFRVLSPTVLDLISEVQQIVVLVVVLTKQWFMTSLASLKCQF